MNPNFSAAAISPEASLLTALSKGIIRFPGFDSTMLRKNPLSSPATAKGHLDQVRQGMRNTAIPDAELFDSDVTLHPPCRPCSSSRATVAVKIIPFSDMRYTDLTGLYPIQAKSGHQYLLIMLSCNYILLEPMRSRDQAEFVNAYSRGTDFFTCHGISPQHEQLNNETFRSLERYFATHEPRIHIQDVSPHNHRANIAVRAIRTWKNHFISILSTVDPTFPLDVWDLLLPQSELTINLLRSSYFCPHTSAWHALHGSYNFNHEPIAPPRIRITCFETPLQRASWAPHGIDGNYVGPSFNHHRCFKVHLPRTGASRDTAQRGIHPLYTHYPEHPHMTTS